MIQSELVKEENRSCAECYAPDPGFVSLNLGVFVCKKCYHFHRKLSIDRSNAVSVSSHPFTDEQIAFIKSRGNKVAAEKFEKYLPKFYHRPDPDDPPLIREQFIRAKYDREEFKDISKQEGYSQGSKTGSLFKKGKDNDRFLRRKFVLKEPEGILEYFIKFSDRVPKDSIVVRNLVNIYVAPEKIGNPNGMQITYEKDGVRRNLYVFGNDGKTTADWYHAIRASMVKHKYQSFPDDQMKRYLNTKILREGWMSKTGPKRQERFRKRWFSLVGTMIWYYEHPLDAHPISYIPLGSKTFGYGTKKGLPQGVKVDGYGLTIHTPERVYALTCTAIESRDKWIAAIENVLEICTNAWTPLNKNNKENGDKSKDTEKPEEKEEEEDNPSSFSTTSAKYRFGSGSDDSSGSPDVEADKPSPQHSALVTSEASKQTDVSSQASDQTATRTPLFEKKTKPTHNPPKYGRKNSAKRISSTKKVTDTEFHRPESDDDLDEVEEDPSTTSSPSKRYSDDSDIEDDDDNVVKLVYEAPIEKTQRKDIPANEAATPPQKPPRKHLGSSDTSPGSSQSNSPVKQPSTGLGPSSQARMSSGGDVIYDLAVDPKAIQDNNKTESIYETITVSSNAMADGDKLQKKFKASMKKVVGQERASIRRTTPPTSPRRGSFGPDEREVKPRPIDVTLINQTEDSFWFMAFQCEEELDDVESYVTPWIGAKVAEAPASVGAIRIPNEFEVGVIDTAPGGFGLQRTTGPFYAQLGDVWEVEIPKEDGAAPELYFHEGMETEDGSVMIYSNPSNEKKFEVAIYKSGRKLFSRKNVKPGDPINFRINPTIFFLQVDQDSYYDMQGEDVRASEWIQKANQVELNYRHSKLKVFAKKRGDTIFFTKS